MPFSIIMIISLTVFILIVFTILKSLYSIGPTEVGLIIKRLSFKKLKQDDPIAYQGEAGYQAKLLMPGLRFKLWPINTVQKYPWVQVPAGEIGVVISQVGKSLPVGAKSAIYNKAMGTFTNFDLFLKNGGEKGVQRPVLLPGTLAPMHPVGFLIITKRRIFGIPVDPKLRAIQNKQTLTCNDFGLKPEQLDIVRIQSGAENRDMIGVVTTHDGNPLDAGDIANRLGGFADITKMESDSKILDADLVELILGSKNHLHNNFQDFQSFIDNGGRIGLQHDPLLYGSYALNPFLVAVEIVPMLVVEQGQVAVVKSYVGLVTKDTSGDEFKFGSLVRPGHRGIWQEPLRTGKYPINPRCYQPVIVPTSILTLNWAEATSKAHDLDSQLSQIDAKSKEGFEFAIDLQVQIHISDTKAPKVISMVGTMQNLINEVLQAAVGNHFRDKLQSMKAIEFIEHRQQVQEDAFDHISGKLTDYKVETKGVYIQDVVLPGDLVKVLTQREIASQEVETFKM
ncbi:MAG: SPFH domain-containing protein, partial [Candidatus Pacearchaeota archaeon]|nr:SPFH domain-containing protein [Candidatus Pacearchaeota archaeon]